MSNLFVLVQGDSENNLQRNICSRVSNLLEKRGFQVEILDREDYNPEQLFIAKLKELHPYAVFTIDRMGFDCKTVGDDISYNTIPCRMIHILTKAPWEYENLNQRYNFTMFFYCLKDEYEKEIRKNFDRIINVKSLGDVIQTDNESLDVAIDFILQDSELVP